MVVLSSYHPAHQTSARRCAIARRMSTAASAGVALPQHVVAPRRYALRQNCGCQSRRVQTYYVLAYRLTEAAAMRGSADNLDRQSLRGFLHMVETQYPDELLRIARAGRSALRHDRDRVRAGARGQEPGGRVRKGRRLRHAGRHQRGGEPAAAGGLPRRRSARPAERIPRALPEIHSVRDGGSGGLERRRHRGRRRRSHQVADHRCNSPSTARPTSPPGRFRRAIRKAASTPPASTG